MNSPINKAIAAVVGAVVSILVVFNIEIDEELQAAIITVATAAAVYFAPRNAPR